MNPAKITAQAPKLAAGSTMPALHRQLENIWGEIDRLRTSIIDSLEV